MRTIESTIRSALVWLCLLLASCGGPFFFIPGGELTGTLETRHIKDWSFIDAPFVELETNGDSLRSVQLNYIIRDGNLYIDPSEDKTWFTELQQNTNVRVRFGDQIYPVKATLVGKPGELEGFDPERYIYQLESTDNKIDNQGKPK